MTDFTVDDAGDFIDSIRARKRRQGLTRERTWEWIAARIGVPSGTIETLARRRAKRPIEGLARKLQNLLIAELEADIGRLTHELGLVRSLGGASARFDLQQIEAKIEAAQALIAEGRGR